MTAPVKSQPSTRRMVVEEMPTLSHHPAESPPQPGPGGSGGQNLTRVVPTTPGANVTAIQPGQNDLRGTQITPGASDRLTSMTAQTDTARSGYAAAPGYTPFQAVPTAGSSYTQSADALSGQAAGMLPAGGYQPVAAGTMGGQAGSLLQQAIGSAGGIGGPAFGADTTAARAATMGALDALNTGPNRGEIASGYYDNLVSASAPQFESDLRRVGQKAAALGRVGAGMTTSDLGTVQQRREEDLARARSGLALDAASREMEDRLARVQAGQGVAGTFGGLDLGASGQALDAARSRTSVLSGLADQSYGMERGYRDEARGEQDRGLDYGIRSGDYLSRLSDQAFTRGASLRDEDRVERGTQRDFETGDFDRVRTQLGDFAGLEDNQRRWEASDRDELRGERGYQDDLAQTGIDRAIQQRGFEEDLLGSQWGRDRDELEQLYRMGYGEDPTGMLTGLASGYSNQASQDYAGAGDALGEYLLQQQANRGMSRGAADQIIGTSRPQVRPAAPRAGAPLPITGWNQPV